jgi:hypothetical protein
MSVFVISPLTGNHEALAVAVKQALPELDAYRLANGGWLVKFGGTSNELSDKLGVTGNNAVHGSTLIAAMSGYYGRGPTEMWEWLKSRWE